MNRMHQTQTSGMFSPQRDKFEQRSNVTYDQKKMFDGTSEHEINKALSTFLNNTGPADY